MVPGECVGELGGTRECIGAPTMQGHILCRLKIQNLNSEKINFFFFLAFLYLFIYLFIMFLLVCLYALLYNIQLILF